jgi:predicted MFS family arabinose efflux permease
LFAFGALAVVLEAPLLAMAHGRRERPLRTAGLAVMALATTAAALSPSYELFLVALALYGPASGLGTNLSESALVGDACPGRREAVLARWSLAGLVGDLAAPAVLALSIALGFHWRGALLACGALAAVQAVLSLRAPPATVSDCAETSPRQGLRAAVRCPRLAGWSLAAVPCAFMDEILVAFGAIWLSRHQALNPTERAVVLIAGAVGAIAGAALLERIAARVRASTLLAASGLGCAAAYSLWLATRSFIASALAFGLVGMFAAAHHPLLRARAFASMPDGPHLVLASGSLFGALELGLPLAVGVVADRAGIHAAMAVLFAQPLAVLVAAAYARREEQSGERAPR